MANIIYLDLIEFLSKCPFDSFFCCSMHVTYRNYLNSLQMWGIQPWVDHHHDQNTRHLHSAWRVPPEGILVRPDPSGRCCSCWRSHWGEYQQTPLSCSEKARFEGSLPVSWHNADRHLCGQPGPLLCWWLIWFAVFFLDHRLYSIPLFMNWLILLL